MTESQVSLYRSEKAGSEVLSKPIGDETKTNLLNSLDHKQAGNSRIIHVSDMDASQSEAEAEKAQNPV